MNNMIATFDIDGVIFLGWDKPGIYPGPNDIIITGRSNQEMPETLAMLKEKGIGNIVYFNPIPFSEKTRISSAYHKVATIKKLVAKGENIWAHFEDDPIQAEIIKKECPEINIVLVQHDLIEKENVRHVRN